MVCRSLCQLSWRGFYHPTLLGFSAAVVPINKKDGGIRPVVVGETLREKKKPQKPQKSTTPMRKHSQLEAGELAAQSWAQNLDGGRVLVKIDLSNAFNSVDRIAV